MRGLRWVMVVLLAAFSALPAFAEPVALDPVVVTATRTARPSSEVISSVTVITAEEIAVSGAKTLAEALRGSVGLHIRDSGTPGSKASVSIRGSESAQVLVLLDGVRLNSAQFGMANLSDLPVAIEDIERIEILRGPASALYGSSALGGVIQIFTKKATSEPLTRLSYSEERFDTRAVNFSTSGTKENFRYQLGAGRGHSNGYRDNSKLDQTTFNATIGYALPAGFDLSFTGYQMEKDMETPGSVFSPTPDANQDDEVTQLSMAITGPAGPVKLFVRPTYSRHRNAFVNPKYWEDDRHILETFGLELQGEIASGKHLLVIGSDFYRDELDSTSAIGQVDQDRWALFGQYEYQYSPRLALLLGVRYDAHSEFDNEASPRVGARFNLTDLTRIRVSAGRAYRAPTLNDLFWPNHPIWGGGNPDLDPETSWEYEVAVDQTLTKSGRFTVAFFDRHAKDLIVWGPKMPENVRDARIWGVEAEFYLRPTDLLGFGLNYTYLHPKDKDTGEYLDRKTRHEANAYVELGPLWDTTLRLDGKYYDNYRYYEDDYSDYPNIIKVKAPKPKEYAVFDLTATRPIALNSAVELELTLGVKNLFNKDYQEDFGYPMPPRRLFAGLTAHF